MDGDGEHPGAEDRRVRDLLGLVKFCLDTTAKDDTTTDSTPEQMDPERRAWLQEALSSMTIDVVAQIVENLTLLKKAIGEMNKNDVEIDEDEMIDAMDYLLDLCEEIDYARDFCKLNGFEIFTPLLKCNYINLQTKACDLIAGLAQNNPYCQEEAFKTGILGLLSKMVGDHEEHVKLRVKSLYALSTIVRANKDTLEQFDTKYNGLTILAKLLQIQPRDEAIIEQQNTGATVDRDSENEWWRKLRIKSAFLIAALCSENCHVVDVLFSMGMVEQVMLLLQTLPHDETHEYLLSILTSLCRHKSEYRQECLRPEFRLASILEEKLADTKTDESEKDIIVELKTALESSTS